MNVVDTLRERLANAKARGHEHVLLEVHKRPGYSPRNWDRVRVISGHPSLMGRLEAWLYFKGVRDA